MKMLENIKYVFQIPIGWFRRVAAFCFKTHGGTMISVNRRKDGSAVIAVADGELKKFVSGVVEDKIEEAASTFNAGSPTAFGSSESNEVTQTGQRLWDAGGADGAELLVFFKAEKNAGIDKHNLFAAKLGITADGRIYRIDAVSNGGIKFPRETAPSILKTITQNSSYHYGPEDQSIPNPTSSNNHMKTDTWTRGDVDGSNRRQGVKVPVFTRCVDGGTKYYLMFRELTFDSLGRLTNVSKELGSYNIEGL